MGSKIINSFHLFPQTNKASLSSWSVDLDFEHISITIQVKKNVLEGNLVQKITDVRALVCCSETCQTFTCFLVAQKLFMYVYVFLIWVDEQWEYNFVWKKNHFQK